MADDPRKGSTLLMEAMRKVTASAPVTVVSFGGLQSKQSLPQEWHSVGRVADERLMNLYYNAADIFVHPSLADNLPNTLVEAAAAGVPSVTFDIGGCGEVVRHQKTGYVAKYMDVDDLAKGLTWVLGQSEEGMQRLRAACREVAVNEYDVALMAERYVKLFERLLGGGGRRTEGG